MTMPFKVTDETELRNLAPGDEVTFRLHVSEQDNWIDEIRKTGKTDPLNRSASDAAPIIKPLKVGERVPDYVLTDESGRSIRLDQFKGNALALTFVFTRCPVPDFCRRMSSNFAEAGEQLAARKSPRNWHLLSISFDPEFDTPAELKRYGERYPHDPERWTFATAEMSVVDRLAGRFGLVVRRNGSEPRSQFAHGGDRHRRQAAEDLRRQRMDTRRPGARDGQGCAQVNAIRRRTCPAAAHEANNLTGASGHRRYRILITLA